MGGEGVWDEEFTESDMDDEEEDEWKGRGKGKGEVVLGRGSNNRQVLTMGQRGGTFLSLNCTVLLLVLVEFVL